MGTTMKLISEEVPVVTGVNLEYLGEDAHADAINRHLAKHPIAKEDWPEFQPNPIHEQRMSRLAKLKRWVGRFTDME